MILVACSHALIGTFMLAVSHLPHTVRKYDKGYVYRVRIGVNIEDETENWLSVTKGGKKLTVPLVCKEVKETI